MAKNLSVSVLMDFYGALLTEKQKEALELYYNQDFSLAEIAENMDISRQGVRDFIKRGEAQLEEFEERLGLLKRFSHMSGELERLSEGLLKLSEAKLAPKDAEIAKELLRLARNLEDEL